MAKKVRSAKGVMVDFDFLKIKEGLASAPTPIQVRERQDFIESRSKRRIKKLIEPIAEVNVSTELPNPDGELTAPAMVEDVNLLEDGDAQNTEQKDPLLTKQKARKKKITENKEK